MSKKQFISASDAIGKTLRIISASHHRGEPESIVRTLTDLAEKIDAIGGVDLDFGILQSRVDDSDNRAQIDIYAFGPADKLIPRENKEPISITSSSVQLVQFMLPDLLPELLHEVAVYLRKNKNLSVEDILLTFYIKNGIEYYVVKLYVRN